MKQLMNITTYEDDLGRYRDRADLEAFYCSFGLDGLELMEGQPDRRGLLTAENVVGAHLRYDSAWMDFWLGNLDRLTAEFGSLEAAYAHFGGSTRQALVGKFQNNLNFFIPYQPEYLVLHVSDCTMAESMLRNYHYTGSQVIDAAAQLVNGLEIPGQPWLLFENLWYPGLNMLEPELIPRLLEQVQYPKTGVMLDVGHLLHTNPDLKTDDQAVDYIHRVLDRYDDLSFIRGIHLHESLSGPVIRRCMESWRPTEGTYQQRMWEVMGHIFEIDTHQPFRSPRIREILERIQPDYLVWEQISATRTDHARTLAQQQAVLTGGTTG